jgi:hypothetical protein
MTGGIKMNLFDVIVKHETNHLNSLGFLGKISIEKNALIITHINKHQTILKPLIKESERACELFGTNILLFTRTFKESVEINLYIPSLNHLIIRANENERNESLIDIEFVTYYSNESFLRRVRNMELYDKEYLDKVVSFFETFIKSHDSLRLSFLFGEREFNYFY